MTTLYTSEQCERSDSHARACPAVFACGSNRCGFRRFVARPLAQIEGIA